MQGGTVFGPKDGFCLITTESSAQAITFTGSSHSVHISTSMLKTRFRRDAQVVDARRSSDVVGSSDTLSLLPRFASVTNARCLLFGANTP